VARAADVPRLVSLREQPPEGSLGVVDLRWVGVFGRQAEVHDEGTDAGRLHDVTGGLAVRVHRGGDGPTEVEVKQRAVGISALGNAPEGGDAVRVDFGVGDAFRLGRRPMVRIDDVADDGQVKARCRRLRAHASKKLRELPCL
jgi:hypothetical protein